MEKTKVTDSFFRRAAGLVVGMASALLLATGAFGQSMSRITAEEVKSGVYSTGDTLKLKVALSDDVTSVVKGASTVAGGYPYLRLNVQSPSGLARAEYESYAADGVVFAYKVQPGDFVDKISVTGLELNTGRIVTEEGDLSDLTLPPASRNLAGVEIPVRTVKFSDGTTATTLSGSVGGSVSVTLSRGDAVDSALSFTVTPSVTGKIDIPTCAIPAGAASVVYEIPLVDKTDGYMTVTFHPVGYTGTDGDLTLSLLISEPDVPQIISVNDDGAPRATPYAVGETIDISVQFNGKITSVSGNPSLKLDIQSPTPDAKMAVYTGEYDGDMMFFQYTVQPGDFAADLDCVNFGFTMNGASIQINGVALGRSGYRAMPTGGIANSLSANADIKIQTISFSDYSLAASASGKEGDTVSVEITRRAEATAKQAFNITVSENGKVSYPTAFAIPAGAASAFLDVNLIERTDSPLILTLRPTGYTSAAGDLVLTLDITAGEKPAIFITGSSQMTEGDPSTQLAVSLARAPKTATTVTLTSDDGEANLKFLGTKSLTWAAGEEGSKTVTVQPLDGGKNVTVTANDASGAYNDGVFSVYVENKNPTLIAPAMKGNNKDEPWEDEASEGFAYTLNWSGADVQADIDTLTVTISWGDGTTTTHNGATGFAQHLYTAAGTFNVTVTLRDKDGGVDSSVGKVTVASAVTVVINEYKHLLDGQSWQGNTYKGLQGLGRGTVDDNLPATTRTLIYGDYNWGIKYSPTQRDVIFTAVPETFEISEQNAEGELETKTYDSFFHVWINSDEGRLTSNALIPISENSTVFRLITDNAADALGVGGNIGAVFSRERYPEDGCADIDLDGLPDKWEELYFGKTVSGGDDPASATYTFESVIGDNGENGNPDNDFLPAGCVKDERVVYPLDSYAPNGLAFNNLYEVRGFHHGLNMKPNDFSEESGPIDEPHKGKIDKDGKIVDTDIRDFYGTDPTSADSDGDGLLDGYEYYWWRVGEEAANTNNPPEWYTANSFRKYNPLDPITDGDEISPNEIILVFHPQVPTSTADGFADIDGDGLSNLEEMLLGTNPLHWDSDGDTMNDGWEVMWGLNPLDPKDAAGNPDGDFMAAYGTSSDNITLRHSDVYKTFGFDARTAWIWQYKDRNHKVAPSEAYSYAPNTMPYTNAEEYYLGHWCVEQMLQFGIQISVDPLSREWFTQPVPAGQLSYMPNGKINTTTYSADSTNGVDTANGTIKIPPETLVYMSEITTHGCDSDGDGMPDGWELYVCCGDNDFVQKRIWPTSDDGSSARDADSNCDFDSLVNIEECHSTDLCDYYTSIYSNFTASVNGNWYNKWWPTDPWNLDTDYDGLMDSQEGDTTFRYAETRTLAELEERYGANTMTRGHVPGGGLNPNAVDTDMDYLPDFFEWQYAGFNRDTDWEGGFVDQPGLYSRYVNGSTIELVGGGMDGTYFDSRNCYDEFEGELPTASATNKLHYIDDNGVALRDFDFDHDGLSNYQEYWINGMLHFQYDKWVKGLDYGDYDTMQVFATGPFSQAKALGVYWIPADEAGYIGIDMEPGSITYDWSRYAENWQEEGNGGPTLDMAGNPIFPFYYMPPESRPAPIGPLAYASADPRLADSDGDNMDDYYEMFHGLNPILSQNVDICNQIFFRPPDVYDFNECPWLAGTPNADPDQDGLPNWEEALSPNEAAPANFNTDPSPLWFTDISYSHSFVNLYYNFGSVMNYWCPEGTDVYKYYPEPGTMLPGMPDPRPNYLFSFEMNEGFDTDNDNLSDRYELFGTSGGVTDPQDSDRPVGRKALYLDGNAAARTRGVCAFGKNALRSWTVEVWVRPEDPASGKRQVILERPCTWDDGDSTPTYDNIRRTFRLGIETDGRPFIEFNNGGKDYITEQAVAGKAYALQPNEWQHLAATFDGVKMQLKLYVNGQCVVTKPTSSIPYTGFTYSGVGTVNGDYSNPRWSPIVIGASDNNPDGHVDGGYFYSNNSISKLFSQPLLGDFFKGWVDEVRVWTGARPGGEDSGDQRVAKWGWSTIRDDYESLKRYGSAEVLKTRNDTVKNFERILAVRKLTAEAERGNVSTNGEFTTWSFIAEGMTFDEFYESASEYMAMTGGETVDLRIPPNLLCCYNFDNLPDPNYEPAVPAKFESLNGRPVNYAGAPWWRQANDRTTVYKGAADAPYCFPHYAENLVATLPLGKLTKVGVDTDVMDIIPDLRSLDRYEYEADHVVDSVFWTKYTKAGIPLAECTEYGEEGANYKNTFPNKANPYGEYYITSNSSDTESHPTTMLQESFDPVHAVMYNHLLPLRNAYADMGIQLWDDPNGTGRGVNEDSDGDGLPDYFEIANGMNPYDADENKNGIPDAYDDFDGDGLSNLAEWKAGTNPNSTDTDGDGVSDYFDTADGSARSNGLVYTDNDYLSDMWEQQWDDIYASTMNYDEHLDRDLDGWDNWSEQLFTYDYYDVTADVVVKKTGTLADKAELNLVTDDDGTWYGRNYSDMVWHIIDARDTANWDETKFVITSDIQYALTRPLYTPVPDIRLTLNYNNGIVDPKFGYWVSDGNKVEPSSFTFHSPSEVEVVVHVYSDRAMNGTPDAVFTRKITNNGIWPLQITLCRQDLIYGHVRQGRNWFFVFVNFDGSTVGDLSGEQTPWGTWSQMAAGGDYNFIEPCGINDDFVEGVDIGWGDNEVRVALTDEAPGFARFSWTELLGNSPRYDDHVVEIRNALGQPVFSKVLLKPRMWIHEGDIIDYQAKLTGNKNFGLEAGGALVTAGETHAVIDNSINPYDWYLDGEKMGSITNFYSSSLSAPVLLSPVNSVVYGARPEFQFRLAKEMTEFHFDLCSSDGSVIYSGRHLAPGRFRYNQANFDLVIWKFPYSAGDVLPNGKVFAPGYEPYYWRVMGYTPANIKGVASETGVFRLATSAEPGNNGDKGVIRVKVEYPGGAARMNGQAPYIRVQAFKTPSFNGRPEAEVTITDPETEAPVLMGLDVGDYYIRAFIDQDSNYIRSNWESWGYLRNESAGADRFIPITAHASQFASEKPVTVTISDADTDNDSIPDALEYIMYKMAKGAVPADDKTWFYPQAWLSLTGPGPVISSPGYTDFDGDGLNDLAELNFGSSPFTADTDGDGIPDVLERQLGFSATSPERLKITSVSFDPNGSPVLGWAWEGVGAESSARATRRSESSVPAKLANAYTYAIEGKVSLGDAEWTRIGTIGKTDDASGAVTLDGASSDEPQDAFHFFRIKLVAE